MVVSKGVQIIRTNKVICWKTKKDSKFNSERVSFNFFPVNSTFVGCW